MLIHQKNVYTLQIVTRWQLMRQFMFAERKCCTSTWTLFQWLKFSRNYSRTNVFSVCGYNENKNDCTCEQMTRTHLPPIAALMDFMYFGFAICLSSKMNKFKQFVIVIVFFFFSFLLLLAWNTLQSNAADAIKSFFALVVRSTAVIGECARVSIHMKRMSLSWNPFQNYLRYKVMRSISTFVGRVPIKSININMCFSLFDILSLLWWKVCIHTYIHFFFSDGIHLECES